MPLLTTAITNLLGGVNQQPASIRNPTDAEVMDNAVPSPVEGLIKRPPTESVAMLANESGNLRYINSTETLFVHLIERDETERYLLAIQENGTADIYDLSPGPNYGLRKTLTLDSSNGGVSLGTAVASKRKALTIGDVTFLTNGSTTVAANTTSLSTANPSNYNRAGLLWVKQSNYNRTHTVKITNGGVAKTFTHVTRDVSINKAGSSGVDGTYSGIPLTYVSGTKATTYPTATITVSGGKVSRVQILTDGTGWQETIDTVLSAASASIGTVTGFEVTIKNTTSGEIGPTHVAEALFNGEASGYIGPVGGIKGTSPYTASTYTDGVIYLQGSADFTVVVEDDFAGDGIVYIRDTVDKFEDLPPTAPNGYTVKVVGTPESEFDDYYVKFVADNGSFSRGVWEETISPGLKYKYNYDTMPLILIRQANGTFFLKRADGTNGTGGQSGQTYTQFKWVDRLVGNDDTNPFPSFVGLTINDMVFYQNRLGFMAGENLVFSETSEFFNFFRTTTLNVLDSDPIDVASSSPRVGKVVAAIPFNRDLILFTPTSQQVLKSGEILSPKSIAIISVAEYDNQGTSVKPVPSATSVYFSFSNGGFTGIRELIPQPNLDGSYMANDLTTNVARYIPGVPTHLAASTHDNLAVVVAGGNLYMYRFYYVGDQRVQSAWYRFTFDDSSALSGSFAKVLWAGFIESELYVAMLRTRTSSTGYIALEKIRLGAGLNDSAISGKTWITNLDQRAYRTAGAGSYNATTGITTFTLPKPMSYAAGKTKVVTHTGVILPLVGGTAFNTSTEAAGTVQVIGKYDDVDVWIGTNYEMLYQFSTQYLKGAAGANRAALLSGRFQLRYLTLQYAESGYFRIEVDINNEDTYEYPFTGEVIGTSILDSANLLTGAFRVPVFSRNENITIKLINDAPLPCKILSGELEATYDSRASRYSG